MRIAIIGGGISGLVAAYHLQAAHDVTLFEANARVGGHTHTVDVEVGGMSHSVDMGFIVFNEATYPHFTRLLKEWGVPSQPTTMSFSVRCDQSGLEYRGADWNGLFAQRRNLFNPRFYRLLTDIPRFNRLAEETLAADDHRQTVGQFFREHRFSTEFREQYFLPLGSAVWSCPRDAIENFPIRFIAEFYRNHGMLNIRKRPQWRVVAGGSKRYIEAMLRRFRGRLRSVTPIASVERGEEGVSVTPRVGMAEDFDHVVFACHSDQALRILGSQATPLEHELLSAFPYESNSVVLHTDASVLPRCKRAWACWNYHLPNDARSKATVTYCMNMLQGIRSPETFLVTLNGDDMIDPRRVIHRVNFHHPVFDVRRHASQQRHRELINFHRTSFCGAYWGNGFHEDGVASALAVCRALGESSEHAQLPVRRVGAAQTLVAG